MYMSIKLEPSHNQGSSNWEAKRFFFFFSEDLFYYQDHVIIWRTPHKMYLPVFITIIACRLWLNLPGKREKFIFCLDWSLLLKHTLIFLVNPLCDVTVGLDASFRLLATSPGRCLFHSLEPLSISKHKVRQSICKNSKKEVVNKGLNTLFCGEVFQF